MRQLKLFNEKPDREAQEKKRAVSPERAQEYLERMEINVNLGSEEHYKSLSPEDQKVYKESLVQHNINQTNICELKYERYSQKIFLVTAKIENNTFKIKECEERIETLSIQISEFEKSENRLRNLLINLVLRAKK